MGKIHVGAMGLSLVKALREQSSDPGREQGHSSRTRAARGAWAASSEQPGQHRQQSFQHWVDFSSTAPCDSLEGFESGNRHIHFIKLIGQPSGVSKSLLFARLMYQKFAAHSSGVSKVCCSHSVSTTCAINNFQQDASFSKIKQFLKFLLKVT